MQECGALLRQAAPGARGDFADEVRGTFERIQRYPHAWTRLSEKVRRCRTDCFPYGVVYAVRGEEIFVWQLCIFAASLGTGRIGSESTESLHGDRAGHFFAVNTAM